MWRYIVTFVVETAIFIAAVLALHSCKSFFRGYRPADIPIVSPK